MGNHRMTLVLGSALVLLTAPVAQAITWQSALQWILSMQNELSGWAVTVKQTALAANQVGQARLVSQQQLATAMGAIAMSERMSKAVMAVDPNWGQPVTLKCEAQKDATSQVEAWHQVSLDRSKLMATFASTRVADQAHAERERMALHRDSYCTVSEAKVGMCQLTANGMQGWDVNYAGAFAERTLPAEGELAGYAYAAMVADTRAPAVADCKSTACVAAAEQQLARVAAGTLVADAIVGQVLERRVPMLTGQ
ncbi:MAG: hypothetical protein JWL65_3330 [Gammaproteobacteria bacterium]|nr:hypothetical protein [Gammaproteobacteria bacterium]